MFRYILMISKLFPSFLLIIIIGSVPSYSSGPVTDYCSIECPSKMTHTVCDRKNHCGPLEPCTVIDSDVAFRTHMVNVHNELRNDVASGKEKGPYNNPGAKYMNAVSYDMELEYIAACWNNKCAKFEHDKCRNSKRFAVGQNMYMSTKKNASDDAVPSWFGEIQYMTDANWLKRFDPKNFPQDGHQRGHFTQIVWANVQYIGCSVVAKDSSKTKFEVICNYGPAGNYLGQPVYEFAESPEQIASMCKDGKKNSQYTSLCGDIEPIPKDPMWSGTPQMIPIPIVFHIGLYCCLVFYTKKMKSVN